MCGSKQMAAILVVLACTLPAGILCAQDPISGIISTGIGRVIRAFDLQVQRMQTRTILLQTAQKEIENAMQALHLDEIRDWVSQLKELYGDYFAELWRVKAIIAGYHEVKRIIERESQLMDAYRRAWALLREDGHFTAAERVHMEGVYQGLLEQGARVLNRVLSVTKGLITQMSDGGRLRIIHQAAEEMDACYSNLLRFNGQNALLSLQRAADREDVARIKKLYGLE